MAAAVQPASSSSSSSSSSQQTITTRLHISGLSATLCSLQDLTNRFTPYASVHSISHWPPTTDASGLPRDWAFVTLIGDRDRIRKCINTLSGTVWKGRKVRIGEAKKDFTGRFGPGSELLDGWARLNQDDPKLSKEGVEDSEEGQMKKRRKRKRNIACGREEQRTSKGEVITEEDVKAGKVWGWRITPAGHLIRPLQMRPSHPLPPASTPSSSKPASSSSPTKSKRSKKDKEPTVPKTITRARSQLIDPARYGAIHLSGTLLDDSYEDQQGRGELWVCEEVDGEEGRVRWVKTGAEDQMEEVQIAGPKEVARLAEKTSLVVDHPEVQDSSSSSSDSSSSGSPSSSSSSSSSESKSGGEEESQRKDTRLPDQERLTAKGVQVHNEEDFADGTFQLSRYDPEEEDAFSEGYNEDTPAHQTGVAVVDRTLEEKERELKLLREMFGSKDLKPLLNGSTLPKTIPGVDDDGEEHIRQDEDDDEDEGEGEWWKQLRGDKMDYSVEVEPEESRSEGGNEKEFFGMQVDETSVEPTHAPAAVAVPMEPQGLTHAPAESSSPPPVLSKRAALLAQMRAASTSTVHAPHAEPTTRGFQPVQRFEPSSIVSSSNVTAASEESKEAKQPAGHDALRTTSHQSQGESNATHQTISPTSSVSVSEVKMGSLKDMFKPQEGGAAGAAGGGSSAGFSLFGATFGEEDLDEDFDFGFDDGDGDDDDVDDSGDNAYGTSTGRSRVWGRGQTDQSSMLRQGREGGSGSGGNDLQVQSRGPAPLFFPHLQRDHQIRGKGHNSSGGGSGDGGGGGGIDKPFYRTDSLSEIEAIWSSRKVDLTQDYKRRHREAVKKKRRKVVGSRRSGEVGVSLGLGGDGGDGGGGGGGGRK